MNFSVEVECGYIRKDGGNFDGVCHGLDQAVSIILKEKNIIHLSQNVHANLGFLNG